MSGTEHHHRWTIVYVIIGIVIVLAIAEYARIAMSNSGQAQPAQTQQGSSGPSTLTAEESAQKSAAMENAMNQPTVTLSAQQSAAKASLLKQMGAKQ